MAEGSIANGIDIDPNKLMDKMKSRLGDKEAEIATLYVALETLVEDRDEAVADNGRLRKQIQELQLRLEGNVSASASNQEAKE